MDILERTLSYDEVTEIFVRVNSLGTKLRSSDLALAQITAKWRGALKIFQGFQGQCANAGFDLDLGLHLKNMVAFGTGQSRFLTVGGLPLETLQRAWKECVPGMEFALNFLKSNAGLDTPALLSSPFLLVTLGYYGHKRKYQIESEEAQRLRHWTLVATRVGRARHCSIRTSGASWCSTPPAVPPRLSEGCAQKQLHGSRGRRPTSPSSAAKPIARSATNRRASISRVCSRKAGSQRSMLSASLRTPISSVSRNYKSFLLERRRLIAQRLNTFLGVTPP